MRNTELIVLMADFQNYACEKLVEASKNDSGDDMRYWAAYRDGVNGLMSKIRNVMEDQKEGE